VHAAQSPAERRGAPGLVAGAVGLVGVVLGAGQQPPGARGDGGRKDHSGHREVNSDGDGEARRYRSCGAPHGSSDAPPAVEGIDDRPAVPRLDAQPVGVHADVGQVVARAEDEERRGEQRPRRRECGRGQRETEDDAGEGGRPAAAESVDESAGERARGEGAYRRKGQCRTEGGVGQVELVLERRQARHDVRPECAVDEEQHARRDAGVPHLQRQAGEGRVARRRHDADAVECDTGARY
jgi:hypothetical protein